MEYINLKNLADIIFKLIPRNIQQKYKRVVFGETLTLKDQFISYCESGWKYPKYSEEESRRISKEILENTSFQEKEKFDFSIFQKLLGNHFDIPEKK